jgi:prepilin signal peptidase PulO-like enzyme (type II secretory pathway)
VLFALGLWRGAPGASSVVTATGLGALGVSDAKTRRLPRTIVRLVGAAVVGAFVTSALSHKVSTVSRGGLAAFAVSAVVGAVWFLQPNCIAFGDVKVTALATAAAAAVSWAAVIAMLVIACCTGAAFGLVARVRRPRFYLTGSDSSTVPFVACLALGFVVGVSLW